MVAALEAEGFTTDEAKAAIDVLLYNMTKTLMRGGKVMMKNVGTLTATELEAGPVEMFGKTIDAAARLKVKFEVSRNLVDTYAYQNSEKFKADKELARLRKKLKK